MMLPCKRGKNRCGASVIGGLVAAISFGAARCLDCRDAQEPAMSCATAFAPVMLLLPKPLLCLKYAPRRGSVPSGKGS